MALKFTGDNVIDLLDSEQSVLGFSEVDNKPLQTSNGFKALPLAPANLLSSTDVSRASLSVLTVSKIRERVTATSNKTAEGDRVDLSLSYLSYSGAIQALNRAHQRRATPRMLFVSIDGAFGKNNKGIANREVTAE